jgi:hypothetical protein
VNLSVSHPLKNKQHLQDFSSKLHHLSMISHDLLLFHLFSSHFTPLSFAVCYSFLRNHTTHTDPLRILRVGKCITMDPGPKKEIAQGYRVYAATAACATFQPQPFVCFSNGAGTSSSFSPQPLPLCFVPDSSLCLVACFSVCFSRRRPNPLYKVDAGDTILCSSFHLSLPPLSLLSRSLLRSTR